MNSLTKLFSKKSRWFIAAAVVLMVIVVVLIINEIWAMTYSSQDGTKHTQISIYNCFGNYSSNNIALSGLINKYTEENPNVSLSNTTTQPDRFYAKLQADFSADCAADIIIAPPSYDLKQLYRRGYIARLNAELENNSEWASNFDKSILRFVSDNNAEDTDIYGLPIDVEYIVLYYNTEILKNNNIKIPDNYSEFKNAVARLAQANVTPIAMGAADNSIYLYQILTSMFEDSAASDAALPRHYTASIEYMKELYSMGAFPAEYHSMTKADAQKMFLDGSAAMIIETSSFINEITQYANSDECEYSYTEYINKFDIAPFPTDADNENGYRGSFSVVAYNAGDFTIFINKRAYESKHDEIMSFISYLTKPETLRLYLAHTNAIPAVKNIDSSEYKTPLAAECTLAIEKGTKFTTMPIDLTYRYIWFSQLCAKIPNLLSGTESISEIASELERIIAMTDCNKRSGGN